MQREQKRMRWDAVLSRFNGDDKIIGCEVGVWRGKMSEALLQRHKNLFLIMVDRFAPPVKGDSYHTSGSEMALCDQKKYDAVFDECLQKVAMWAGRIKIIKMSTVEAADHVENGTLDFCFIDADHSYEGVKADITAWLPKVKKGCWICGHDWKNTKKGNVEKAVREFFTDKQIQVDANSTWFVKL